MPVGPPSRVSRAELTLDGHTSYAGGLGPLDTEAGETRTTVCQYDAPSHP